MEKEPNITLHCVRKNGSRERTKLSLHSIAEAREVAKRILRLGKGIYTDVDICTEKGPIETIGNSDVMGPEVLLVEDNAGDALMVGQALESSKTPVRLHIARDGEQALQILAEPNYEPDLIILDLNIPKLSGYGVLAAYPAVKKTPVVVFSASENEADVDRAFSLGAREFVHKPLDLDDYKAAVSGMVRRWTTSGLTETLPV
ncbi:MAG TPA: response regulator [Bryobacteraceae bacterium]|nr:response regulator [Bryobacteraceae bacterium]